MTKGGKSMSKSRIAALCVILAALLIGVFSLLPASSSHAASSPVIYNNIPQPLPGNLVSEAFEAQSASEFGGQIAFAGTARKHPTVTVTMSSWGCQTGHWYSKDCVTTPGATFSHPITLNVYNVNPDNSPGTKIATVTKTFNIAYRPSANNTKCTGADAGKWFKRGTCFNGKAVNISFNLGNITLPDKAIVSVAYNTTHYGYSPIGESASCFTSSGGCGYDSLNVGVTAPPSAGTDPLPNDAYLYSSWSGAYCSGAAGTFRLDTGCWTGYQPAIKVVAHEKENDQGGQQDQNQQQG